MKKLDLNALTSVKSDKVIEIFQEEYMRVHKQNITLAAQVDRLQEIITILFKNSPELFPEELVIEEEENVKDK
ncbi:hypothetical protein [Companilactobacillus metriopterae]|uniref:hypothetical protein n=1 Tax=Companilactobacillus metriopterae TaxID=1909267 RepID=UPI00100B6810|nr:hypothetical protein [Companilactobacillus metriopterae]